MEKRTLTLLSDLANFHQVERFVDQICNEFNVYHNYFGNIIVAISEAVENAISHGNNDNTDKQVHLIFEIKPQGLSFTIVDEGLGFDYNTITDPTDVVSDTDANAGRGVFLMRSLADKVIFSDKGNSVELMFYISSINSELSLFRTQQLEDYSKASKKDIKEKTM